jgi:hypothetical protein
MFQERVGIDTMAETTLMKKLQILETDEDLDQAVAIFSPPQVVAQMPLWSMKDCDCQTRSRLDSVRHFRTRLLTSRVLEERIKMMDGGREDQLGLMMDITPLVDGSVDDPMSEAVAALQAGLLLTPEVISSVFGQSTFYLVWRNLKWKEIPKCYGRYTLHRSYRHMSSKHPMDFLAQILVQETDTEILSRLGKSELVVLGKEERDPIVLVPFSDGGGLLSYEKPLENGSVCFVHTLNSPSGWDRKLFALGIKR